MKRSILFTLLFAFVFSLSAQRLNQRGEKMVSHIKSIPMYHDKYGDTKGVSSYDIYFFYDSNDEIRKVNIVAPRWDVDSVVLTKGKNGIIWKNYYNKESYPQWRKSYQVFLDERGRVSRVDAISPNSKDNSRIDRDIIHYIDEPNEGDVCLDIDRHILYRYHDGKEILDGMERNVHVLRSMQIAKYEGGLIRDTRNKNSITGQFDKYGAKWWKIQREKTIIDPCFINDTNLELYTLLLKVDLLLLPRWIPIKADFLPLEFDDKYTDCIYNRNGDLTTIEVYTNSSYIELHGIFIQKINIEYVE